jgi:hypothetical protein
MDNQHFKLNFRFELKPLTGNSLLDLSLEEYFCAVFLNVLNWPEKEKCNSKHMFLGKNN